MIRLLADFNLLVSTSRGNEKNTCSELWYLIGEIGDRSSIIDRTGIIGLVVAKIKIDPVDAVHKLRTLLKERPWEFRYTLKVTPIQQLIPADPANIEKCCVVKAGEIEADQKFRMTVEKRHSSLSTRAIIDLVAGKIDRKVDLENPDRVMMVQIIGNVAGVSLISPNDILSVEREKRPVGG